MFVQLLMVADFVEVYKYFFAIFFWHGVIAGFLSLFMFNPYLPTEEFFRKFTLICLIRRSKKQNLVWFSLKVCILCLFKKKRTVGLNRRSSMRVRTETH